MSCPNCRQNLDTRLIDNQTILYCLNCGGSFFEENSINRISIQTAQRLARDHRTNEIIGFEKHCPIDKVLLVTIQNEESIPSEVTLLRCPKCRGVFSYPDDLLRFKNAQNAKIKYLNTWNLAPQTIKSVLVLTFLGVVSLTILSSMFFLNNSKTTSTQATEPISNFSATKYQRYVFITFKSQIPLKTQIVFYDKTQNTKHETSISAEPKTIHTLTTTELNLEDEIYYVVVGVDGKGKELRTKERKLFVE